MRINPSSSITISIMSLLIGGPMAVGQIFKGFENFLTSLGAYLLMLQKLKQNNGANGV